MESALTNPTPSMRLGAFPPNDAPIDQNLSAPTIYADGLSGLVVSNGVAKINLYEDQQVAHMTLAPTDFSTHRRIAARLVIPLAQFPVMAEWFENALKGLLDNGIVERVEQPPSDTPV